MKFIVSYFFVISSQLALASGYLPEDQYKDYKCGAELTTQIKEIFKREPVWERTVDPHFDTRAFRTSVNLGQWYELRITEGQRPQLNFISAKKGLEYTWSETCKKSERVLPGFEFSKSTKKKTGDVFTDDDLAQIVKSNKSGVIYVWSPRMVYSVTEYLRFRSVIQRMGLDFVPVLDHSVELQEAKDAMKSLGGDVKLRVAVVDRFPNSANDPYRRMNSVDLYMRNSSLHFPTVYVYSKGQIHSRRIIGVMTDSGLEKSVEAWLGEIK